MVREGIKQVFKQTITVFTQITITIPMITKMTQTVSGKILPMLQPGSWEFTLFVSIMNISNNMQLMLAGTFLLSIQISVFYLFSRVTSLRNDDTGIITEERYDRW